MDVETRAVRDVPVDAGTAHLNPQWSADDRELYFVSDPDGTMNIYRAGRRTRATLHRITNVDTGVSGITPTSPALSMAGDASALAFTVYERGRPRLVVLDQRAALDRRAGRRAIARPTPTADAGDDIAGAVDSLSGRSDDRPARIRRRSPSHDYNSQLSLEGVGQPYLSSGGGPFGTFVRGGGALLFGDMLGERRLGAAVQIGNRMRDAAFMFRFLNQERRWNWGAVAELEPSVIRYRRSEAIEHDGQPALLQQADYLQRMQLRAAGVVAYPFSRGTARRIHRRRAARGLSPRSAIADLLGRNGQGAVDRSRRIARRVADDGGGGQRGAGARHDGVRPDGAAAGIALSLRSRAGRGAAVVHERDRGLPSVPDAGASVLDRACACCIRAAMAPTAAIRGLLSNFLGSSYFVRGHRQDLRYCRPDATRVCGDDLLGSRLLVGNVEVRVPLWGIRSRQIDYGSVPGRRVRVCRRRPHLVGNGNRSRASAIDQQLRRRHPRQRRGLPAGAGRDPRARRPAPALAVRSRLPRRLLITGPRHGFLKQLLAARFHNAPYSSP